MFHFVVESMIIEYIDKNNVIRIKKTRLVFRNIVKLYHYLNDFLLITNKEEIIFLSYKIVETEKFKHIYDFCRNNNVSLVKNKIIRSMSHQEDFYPIIIKKKF